MVQILQKSYRDGGLGAAVREKKREKKEREKEKEGEKERGHPSADLMSVWTD